MPSSSRVRRAAHPDAGRGSVGRRAAPELRPPGVPTSAGAVLSRGRSQRLAAGTTRQASQAVAQVKIAAQQRSSAPVGAADALLTRVGDRARDHGDHLDRARLADGRPRAAPVRTMNARVRADVRRQPPRAAGARRPRRRAQGARGHVRRAAGAARAGVRVPAGVRRQRLARAAHAGHGRAGAGRGRARGSRRDRRRRCATTLRPRARRRRAAGADDRGAADARAEPARAPGPGAARPRARSRARRRTGSTPATSASSAISSRRRRSAIRRWSSGWSRTCSTTPSSTTAARRLGRAPGPGSATAGRR